MSLPHFISIRIWLQHVLPQKLYDRFTDNMRLFQMIKDEGVSSLARGVVPNVFRAVLMNASQLASCVS